MVSSAFLGGMVDLSYNFNCKDLNQWIWNQWLNHIDANHALWNLVSSHRGIISSSPIEKCWSMNFM